MRLHAQQHVSQVLLRVDVVDLAGGHQRVEASQVLSGGLVADKEKGFAAQGRLSQGALAAVVVQRQALVGDEAAQRVPLLQRVGNGPSLRPLRRMPRSLVLEPDAQAREEHTSELQSRQYLVCR